MNRASLILGVFILVAAPACKSEIDNKPAAEVGEASTSATSQNAHASSAGAVTADVIRDKSSIEFVGAKVTRDHHGQFRQFDGKVEYADGKPNRISFEIDLNSVETDTPRLTEHLKSPDFFDVAKNPKATFASTSLEEAPAGSPPGSTHVLRGTLDLHGVTRDVNIPVIARVTPDGVRATSEFTINRHDWGISYRGAADDLIKDEVLIRLNLLFPPPPAA